MQEESKQTRQSSRGKGDLKRDSQPSFQKKDISSGKKHGMIASNQFSEEEPMEENEYDDENYDVDDNPNEYMDDWAEEEPEVTEEYRPKKKPEEEEQEPHHGQAAPDDYD
mmetsp:Transcript_34082/g.52361  ORF Transcript_34082/g.52361 Transcript_34082/m.52361 type:complete len:110 (+) Transcript_34082:916-1245(+)